MIMSERIVLSKNVIHTMLVIGAIGVLLGVVAFSRSGASLRVSRQTAFLLDTVVEITVASTDERHAQNAIAAAYTEMRRVEAMLNRYDPASQIGMINRAAGGAQAISVSPEVFEIVQRALHYSQQTDGAFDMTVGPLIDVWGIGTEHEQVPAASDIQQVLSFVDSRKVEIEPPRGVRLKAPEMALDLGGIAKGYSIDRGVETLRRHDIAHALLNAGGDMRSIGTKPDGAPWRIGIRHPRLSGTMLGILPLQDRAVATSGDYERFFMEQGKRYHHLLIPETGLPARTCQSVTIVADTAEQADVFATAVFIMGPERGQTFLEEQPNTDGMIVRSDGELVVSSGFSFQPMN